MGLLEAVVRLAVMGKENSPASEKKYINNGKYARIQFIRQPQLQKKTTTTNGKCNLPSDEETLEKLKYLQAKQWFAKESKKIADI